MIYKVRRHHGGSAAPDPRAVFQRRPSGPALLESARIPHTRLRQLLRATLQNRRVASLEQRFQPLRIGLTWCNGRTTRAKGRSLVSAKPITLPSRGAPSSNTSSSRNPPPSPADHPAPARGIVLLHAVNSASRVSRPHHRIEHLKSGPHGADSSRSRLAASSPERHQGVEPFLDPGSDAAYESATRTRWTHVFQIGARRRTQEELTEKWLVGGERPHTPARPERVTRPDVPAAHGHQADRSPGGSRRPPARPSGDPQVGATTASGGSPCCGCKAARTTCAACRSPRE